MEVYCVKAISMAVLRVLHGNIIVQCIAQYYLYIYILYI
jgi:hypothetical protein